MFWFDRERAGGGTHVQVDVHGDEIGVEFLALLLGRLQEIASLRGTFAVDKWLRAGR